jgi:hypothetical protein
MEVQKLASKSVAKESERKDVKEGENRADVLLMENVAKAADNALARDNEVISVSLEQARENVRSRVREAAGEIADRLITEAKAGGLAPAKYLFEVTGLYPATKETGAAGNSLAEMLLKRMGIPTAQSGGGVDKKPPALATDPESERGEPEGRVEN